jgi:hypothetical protein
MLELAAVEQAIGQLLLGGGFVPAGTPFEPAPYPEGGTTPAIIYKLISSKTTQVTGNIPIFSEFVYQVVARAEGSNIGVVHDLGLAIYQSLKAGYVTNSDGLVYPFVYERPISIPFRSQSGKQYQQFGSWWRVQASGSNF